MRYRQERRKKLRWGRILGATLMVLVLLCAGGICLRLLMPEQELPSTDSTVPPAVSDVVQDAPEAPDAPSTKDDPVIRTLLNDVQTRRSCYSENGYYYLSPELMMQGACNLKYVDFATQQEIFLCDAPNCTHNTASCSSYIPDMYECVNVLVHENHLFLVYWGWSGNPVSIEIRDLTGANARTLVTLNSGEEFGLSGLAADSENFYFIRQRVENQNGSILYTNTLESVAFDSGTLRTICSLDKEDFFVGTANSTFIIRTLQRDDQNNVLVTHKAVDKQGNAMEGVFLPEPYDSMSKTTYFMDDGTWYEFEYAGSCTINKHDIFTGEIRMITDSFPASSTSTWVGCPTSDGLLPVSVKNFSGEENDRYVLDLASGTWKRHELNYMSINGRENNVAVEGEYNNYYLVKMGETKTTSATYSDKIGLETTDRAIPVFALIQKDDFYNSNANYLPVTRVN